MARRYQKVVALALLLLNISGARVVSVCDACGHKRVYFSPTRGFKAIARTVTRKEWKQRGARSLGARRTLRSSHDLEVVQREKRVLAVAVLPPLNITLGTERSRNRLLYAWKLPRDRSPDQSPQFFSKK